MQKTQTDSLFSLLFFLKNKIYLIFSYPCDETITAEQALFHDRQHTKLLKMFCIDYSRYFIISGGEIKLSRSHFDKKIYLIQLYNCCYTFLLAFNQLNVQLIHLVKRILLMILHSLRILVIERPCFLLIFLTIFLR